MHLPSVESKRPYIEWARVPPGAADLNAVEGAQRLLPIQDALSDPLSPPTQLSSTCLKILWPDGWDSDAASPSLPFLDEEPIFISAPGYKPPLKFSRGI